MKNLFFIILTQKKVMTQMRRFFGHFCPIWPQYGSKIGILVPKILKMSITFLKINIFQKFERVPPFDFDLISIYSNRLRKYFLIKKLWPELTFSKTVFRPYSAINRFLRNWFSTTFFRKH